MWCVVERNFDGAFGHYYVEEYEWQIEAKGRVVSTHHHHEDALRSVIRALENKQKYLDNAHKDAYGQLQKFWDQLNGLESATKEELENRTSEHLPEPPVSIQEEPLVPKAGSDD